MNLNARLAILELAERLERDVPQPDDGVLLSPFDTLLWDRRNGATATTCCRCWRGIAS